jgi:hypothetical protein
MSTPKNRTCQKNYHVASQQQNLFSFQRIKVHNGQMAIRNLVKSRRALAEVLNED